MIIVNASVGGVSGLSIRVGEDRVLAVGRDLVRNRDETHYDAEGGAVLPGLHDHHVHVRAAVAAERSLSLASVSTPDDFDTAVRAAASGGWLRGVGWHEATAGHVDRHRLDALAPGTPVRLQHRSGVLWVLNSLALHRIDAFTATEPGIERAADGTPTGRLWRLDRWLRDRIDEPAPFAAGARRWSRAALRRGVTGFTDATPGRTQADVAEFAALVADGAIAQRVTLMAPPEVRAVDGITLGQTKFVLDDTTLPDVADLTASFAHCHRSGVPVAVHAVTAEQLVVAVATLADAGPLAGDRIEHAAVVPPGFAEQLAALGVAVVTQPAFVAARGDDYLRDVPAAEQPWLYPTASLLRAGVPVAASSDTPYGPDDPWLAMTAAVARRTRSGVVLGPAERVDAATATALWLRDPSDLRRLRTVTAGEPGDLCVLRADGSDVRAVVVGGRIIDADDA